MHRRRSFFRSLVLFGLLSTSGFGLMGLAPMASASHEAVDWSREWRITFDARWQLNPATFTDGAGHLYLFAYDLNSANGHTNITMWRFATRGPSGNPPFPPLSRQVNPTLPNVALTTNLYGQAWPPSVARDHNGALYVAWADTSSNVYVSKSSDNGSSWGAPSRVDPAAPESFDTGPAIVAAPSGTLYVVWNQYWSGGIARSLTVARSTDQGVTWGGKVNITTPTRTYDFYSHSLAVDSAGRLHLAYTSLSGLVSSDAWDSNYTRSDDGASWSAPVRLDSTTTFGIWPMIVADASNRVHVIWYDNRQSSSGTPTYWYRRSNDRGLTWTMEMPISQGRFGTGGSVRLMLSVSGDTVIAGWPIFSPATFGYVVSWDGGDLWTSERAAEVGTSTGSPSLAADENGTFYSAFYRTGFDASFAIWDGPPGPPSITGIARGTNSLTVSWSASPEGDVMGYRLFRSSDGVTYEVAGTFGPTVRQSTDSGLTNGTYWYRVSSFDSRGTSSHPSNPVSASVGKSLQERVNDLEAALASAQADLNAIQAEIDSVQSQLTSQDTALRARIDDLQNRLNTIQAEKATAVQSYLNTVLIIVVILLLVFMFLQSRKMSRPQILSPFPPNPPTHHPPARPMQPSQPPSEPGMSDEEL